MFNIFKKKKKPVIKEENYIGLEEAIKNMNKDSSAIPSVAPVIKKENQNKEEKVSSK